MHSSETGIRERPKRAAKVAVRADGQTVSITKRKGSSTMEKGRRETSSRIVQRALDRVSTGLNNSEVDTALVTAAKTCTKLPRGSVRSSLGKCRESHSGAKDVQIEEQVIVAMDPWQAMQVINDGLKRLSKSEMISESSSAQLHPSTKQSPDDDIIKIKAAFATLRDAQKRGEIAEAVQIARASSTFTNRLLDLKLTSESAAELRTLHAEVSSVLTNTEREGVEKSHDSWQISLDSMRMPKLGLTLDDLTTVQSRLLMGVQLAAVRLAFLVLKHDGLGEVLDALRKDCGPLWATQHLDASKNEETKGHLAPHCKQLHLLCMKAAASDAAFTPLQGFLLRALGLQFGIPAYRADLGEIWGLANKTAATFISSTRTLDLDFPVFDKCCNDLEAALKANTAGKLPEIEKWYEIRLYAARKTRAVTKSVSTIESALLKLTLSAGTSNISSETLPTTLEGIITLARKITAFIERFYLKKIIPEESLTDGLELMRRFIRALDNETAVPKEKAATSVANLAAILHGLRQQCVRGFEEIAGPKISIACWAMIRSISRAAKSIAKNCDAMITLEHLILGCIEALLKCGRAVYKSSDVYDSKETIQALEQASELQQYLSDEAKHDALCQISNACSWVALNLYKARRIELAIPLLKLAKEMDEHNKEPDLVTISKRRELLGICLESTGKPEEAKMYYFEALRCILQENGPGLISALQRHLPNELRKMFPDLYTISKRLFPRGSGSQTSRVRATALDNCKLDQSIKGLLLEWQLGLYRSDELVVRALLALYPQSRYPLRRLRVLITEYLGDALISNENAARTTDIARLMSTKDLGEDLHLAWTREGWDSLYRLIKGLFLYRKGDMPAETWRAALSTLEVGDDYKEKFQTLDTKYITKRTPISKPKRGPTTSLKPRSGAAGIKLIRCDTGFLEDLLPIIEAIAGIITATDVQFWTMRQRMQLASENEASSHVLELQSMGFLLEVHRVPSLKDLKKTMTSLTVGEEQVELLLLCAEASLQRSDHAAAQTHFHAAKEAFDRMHYSNKSASVAERRRHRMLSGKACVMGTKILLMLGQYVPAVSLGTQTLQLWISLVSSFTAQDQDQRFSNPFLERDERRERRTDQCISTSEILGASDQYQATDGAAFIISGLEHLTVQKHLLSCTQMLATAYQMQGSVREASHLWEVAERTAHKLHAKTVLASILSSQAMLQAASCEGKSADNTRQRAEDLLARENISSNIARLDFLRSKADYALQSGDHWSSLDVFRKLEKCLDEYMQMDWNCTRFCDAEQAMSLKRMMVQIRLSQAYCLEYMDDSATAKAVLKAIATQEQDLSKYTRWIELHIARFARFLSRHHLHMSLCESIISLPCPGDSDEMEILPALDFGLVKILGDVLGGRNDIGQNTDVSTLRRVFMEMALCSMRMSFLEQGPREAAWRSAALIEAACGITLKRQVTNDHQLEQGNMAFSESGWPVCPLAKSDSEAVNEDACTLDDFRQNAKSLSAARWNVVHLTLSADKTALVIVRYDDHIAPFCVQIPLIRASQDQDDELNFDYKSAVSSFAELIEEANDSSHSACGLESAAQKAAWWLQREELDKKMQIFLENIEQCWLGGLRWVLLPRTSEFTQLKQLAQAVESLLEKVVLTNSNRVAPLPPLDISIIELISRVPADATDQDMEDLLYYAIDVYHFHGIPVDYGEIDFDLLTVDLREILEAWQRRHDLLASKQGGRPTVLILDPELQMLPWESLPVLRGRPVTRVPSMHELLRRVRDVNDGCFEVDIDRTSYLLNPSADLSHTQDKFEAWAHGFPKWDGIIGRTPSEGEVKNALKTSDIFLYFGHGGAEHYCRSTTIRKVSDCAVTMLWGCSSGHLQPQGGYDPYGTPNNYMINGCKALVANLWDVTDKDIDRLAGKVFQELHMESTRKRGELYGLHDALAVSRDVCRLKYLNGAATVCYGIPVYFRT